jgi:hypothetical protein
MRPVAAIVESVVDFEQNTRAILKEHIALQDDERHADAHERKSAGFREAAARRRVEIGRMLVEQKTSGKIKHGGWLPYLEKLGITPDSASRWMALAGYVEEQIKNRTDTDVRNFNDAPTLADAGIDKRPRKRDEQPDRPAPAQTPSAIDHDDDRADCDVRAVEASLLTMVSNALGTVARKWPGDLRRLVDELRRFADKLERRAKEN